MSDRTGHRRDGRRLRAGAGDAAAIIAVAPTLPATLVAAALIGVGYGIFNAGGLALATDLLPGDDANAQDLGIVNVSANLGQLLGPVIGAGLIALVGGFWLLFAAAAVFSLLGAALTATVRMPEPSPSAPARQPRPADACVLSLTSCYMRERLRRVRQRAGRVRPHLNSTA